MRAAYAHGVLTAFEDAGYRDFDAVYGTSAGGVLAARFAARQVRFGLTAWKYVADRRIISYRRLLLGGGPVLDHDALFRIVYEHDVPIDVPAVQRAAFPVIVTAVDVETGETAYVDVRRGRTLDWLRATGRLPMWAGPPVAVNGRRYLDGGITDPIPIARAIADGATDVICLLNRPPGPRKPEPRVLAWAVARKWSALASLVYDHHLIHNRAVHLAEHPPTGVRVRILRPARATGVGRLTRGWNRIERARQMGYADGQGFVEAERKTKR